MTLIPTLTANDVFQAQRESLALKWLAGHKGQDRPLEPTAARYPGMALVGHLNPIHPNRVQVIGNAEIDYLNSFDPKAQGERLKTLFCYPNCALAIVTNDAAPPAALIDHANSAGIPLFSSPLPSPSLIDSLQYFLSRALAERITLHGVFIEVMGTGVLLTGESGIGKSEVALELLSREHRLIADDAVEIARVAPDTLEGRCPEALCDFMEVRGLGILNIRAMFGETATRREKSLELIVRFEQMSKKRMEKIDRLQAETQTQTILGVEVPEVQLLVAPGRNLAVLVEAAARHHLQQIRGGNPLQDLITQQEAVMEGNSVPSSTPSQDDSGSGE